MCSMIIICTKKYTYICICTCGRLFRGNVPRHYMNCWVSTPSHILDKVWDVANKAVWIWEYYMYKCLLGQIMQAKNLSYIVTHRTCIRPTRTHTGGELYSLQCTCCSVIFFIRFSIFFFPEPLPWNLCDINLNAYESWVWMVHVCEVVLRLAQFNSEA